MIISIYCPCISPPLPLSQSRPKVGVTEPCCMDMLSSWNTLTPAWWGLFTIKYMAAGCSILSSKQQWYLKILTCNPSFLHFSTWAVWLLRAHWQTSWLLMWACRKNPQVALYFILLHLLIFYLFIPNSESVSPQTGEACWWTIHPASKQRSEGEKVRVGDDLILVSVSSERYLVTIIFCLLAS